jgi:purine-nucleoside phosphorylase
MSPSAPIGGVSAFQEHLRKAGIAQPPSYHVVLGSGFGIALDSVAGAAGWAPVVDIPFEKIPSLSASTVPDHAGKYRVYRNARGRLVVFQAGRLHGYEGHPARQVVQTVMIPRMAGVERFLLTNAAGGLVASQAAGDVMIIRDQVNLTGQNPLVGENPMSASGEPLGPRFPDMSQLYDRAVGDRLKGRFSDEGLKVHEGTYLGILGPSFETPAEVALFSRWGLHAVGMSTVWEAIALRHSGAQVAGLSLISNPGCGMDPTAPILDHHQILDTCRKSAAQIVKALLGWLDEELDEELAGRLDEELK